MHPVGRCTHHALAGTTLRTAEPEARGTCARAIVTRAGVPFARRPPYYSVCSPSARMTVDHACDHAWATPASAPAPTMATSRPTGATLLPMRFGLRGPAPTASQPSARLCVRQSEGPRARPSHTAWRARATTDRTARSPPTSAPRGRGRKAVRRTAQRRLPERPSPCADCRIPRSRIACARRRSRSCCPSAALPFSFSC